MSGKRQGETIAIADDPSRRPMCPGRTAAKNILHSHAMRCGSSRSIGRIYGQLGAASQPCAGTDPAMKPAETKLRLLDSYVSRPEQAPSFLRDMEVLDNGTILCVETSGLEVVKFDFRAGPTPLPAQWFKEAFSKTRIGADHILLSPDFTRLTRVDEDFRPKKSYDISTLGISTKWAFISRTGSGFALTEKRSRKVFFFDLDLSPVCTVSLDHLSLVNAGTGYLDGVVVFEWFSGKIDYGEVLWVSASSEVFTLLGGLCKPFCASVFDKGLVVCDLQGLHILGMDGLAVAKRKFLPWRPMLHGLGLDRGYGHEAIIVGNDLVVKFDISPSWILSSRRYCVARFSLESGGWT